MATHESLSEGGREVTMTWEMLSKVLPLKEYLFMFYLVTNTNNEGKVCKTMRRICEETGMSKTTLYRRLCALERLWNDHGTPMKHSKEGISFGLTNDYKALKSAVGTKLEQKRNVVETIQVPQPTTKPQPLPFPNIMPSIVDALMKRQRLRDELRQYENEETRGVVEAFFCKHGQVIIDGDKAYVEYEHRKDWNLSSYMDKFYRKYTQPLTTFVKPTIAEIDAYVKEKGYGFTGEEFYNHYESQGWKVGNAPMKNWKSACTTWQKNVKSKRYGGQQKDDDVDARRRRILETGARADAIARTLQIGGVGDTYIDGI